MVSCQTCPPSEIESVKKRLDPGYFPELVNIDNLSADEKRIVLDFMIDAYGEHLKLLLASKTTGYFIDDIDLEILDCRDALEWLNMKRLEYDLLD